MTKKVMIRQPNFEIYFKGLRTLGLISAALSGLVAFPLISYSTELEWISNMRKSLLCKSIYLRTRVVVLLTNRNDIVNILVTNQPIEIVKTT